MASSISGPGPVRATQKSIEIVRSIKEDGPATVTELATRLEYSKSTIHRHLTTLEDEGYVTFGDGGYRVGLLFLDFGIHARNENRLYQVAQRKVEEIAGEIGENVWCMTEENGYGVFLCYASGKYPIQTYTRVGYRAYLHVFAAGKAILAHMGGNRLDGVIERRGLPARTPRSITDRRELFEALEQVRQRGVAFNLEESINGVNAVAAPIMDEPKGPIGSISVAGPANRLKGAYLERELPELLLGVANEIEVNLAFDGSNAS